MTVNKLTLITILKEKLAFTHKEAADLVKLFFKEIKQALVSGEPVMLSGFGSFRVQHKVKRPGRNPKTGQVCVIEARKTVIFRPSTVFKEGVSQILPQRSKSSSKDFDFS